MICCLSGEGGVGCLNLDLDEIGDEGGVDRGRYGDGEESRSRRRVEERSEDRGGGRYLRRLVRGVTVGDTNWLNEACARRGPATAIAASAFLTDSWRSPIICPYSGS